VERRSIALNESFKVLVDIQVNSIVMQHSKGLLMDGRVIANALYDSPVVLTESHIGRPNGTVIQLVGELFRIGYYSLRKFDLNLHIEDVKPRWLRSARKNWWIPNPEWMRSPPESLREHVDLVLCKTRVAEEVFSSLGFPTKYIGFTTVDRMDQTIGREPRALHVAGNSPNKGTGSVIAAWRHNPEWPTLDVVWNAPSGVENDFPDNIKLHRSPISAEELSQLQNRAIFHICPSSVEGFGHTLVEAMSCGACIVTTAAPPMNELITAERGVLVPWEHTSVVGHANAFHVSPVELTHGVAAALSLPTVERDLLRQNARNWYVANNNSFAERLRRTIASSFE